MKIKQEGHAGTHPLLDDLSAVEIHGEDGVALIRVQHQQTAVLLVQHCLQTTNDSAPCNNSGRGMQTPTFAGVNSSPPIVLTCEILVTYLPAKHEPIRNAITE